MTRNYDAAAVERFVRPYGRREFLLILPVPLLRFDTTGGAPTP